MLTKEAVVDFIDYIDPDIFEDEEGIIIPLKDRSLIPDAPVSAVKAFLKYKKMIEEAKKAGNEL